MIESYGFGHMVIDGTAYRNDLVCRPGDVRKNWRRNEGHRLIPEDLETDLAPDPPDILVVGTGRFGMLRISDAMRRELQSRSIELIAEPTGRAAETFNRLTGEKRKVVGAFHLTC